MRYLTNKEQRRSTGQRKDRWKVGKRSLPATCPTCHQPIKQGEWVRLAPGRGFVLAHGYRCTGSR